MVSKKILFSQFIFLAILAAATLSVLWGLKLGYSHVLVLNAVAVTIFIIILGLEKIMPFKESWNESDPQTVNDLGHTLFGTGLGSAFGDFITKLAFSSVAVWLSQRIESNIWPSEWPLFFQIILVYLIAELGRYWQHRLMHLYPQLWRYHRLHHSIDRMGILKTSRSHVIERVFQQVFMFGWLVAIGTPPEVMLYYIIPNSFLGMIDHSNIDLKLGYLEYIIMGPAGHRLHHSQNMKHGNSNFGSALMFWDMVFGTFTDPVKTTPPDEVGIKNDPMPRGFIDQIADGFLVDGFKVKKNSTSQKSHS